MINSTITYEVKIYLMCKHFLEGRYSISLYCRDIMREFVTWYAQTGHVSRYHCNRTAEIILDLLKIYPNVKVDQWRFEP